MQKIQRIRYVTKGNILVSRRAIYSDKRKTYYQVTIFTTPREDGTIWFEIKNMNSYRKYSSDKYVDRPLKSLKHLKTVVQRVLERDFGVELHRESRNLNETKKLLEGQP